MDLLNKPLLLLLLLLLLILILFYGTFKFYNFSVFQRIYMPFPLKNVLYMGFGNDRKGNSKSSQAE